MFKEVYKAANNDIVPDKQLISKILSESKSPGRGTYYYALPVAAAVMLAVGISSVFSQNLKINTISPTPSMAKLGHNIPLDTATSVPITLAEYIDYLGVNPLSEIELPSGFKDHTPDAGTVSVVEELGVVVEDTYEFLYMNDESFYRIITSKYSINDLDGYEESEVNSLPAVVTDDGSYYSAYFMHGDIYISVLTDNRDTKSLETLIKSMIKE